MQKLTVHIGAIKTGTSAIQHFLARNAVELRRDGIVVPDQELMTLHPVTGEQVFYFDRRFASDLAESRDELTRRVTALFHEAGVEQVVISAENLSDAAAPFSGWFESLFAQYESEVILYIRRQDDLLMSAWQQWYGKVEDDVWSWLLEQVGVLGDWRGLLELWERNVGRERIRVRLYEHQHLSDNDAVADFGQFLIKQRATLVDHNAPRINRSFTEAIVDLIPGGEFFDDAHDDAFYEFLQKDLGDACYRHPEESSLTHRQRIAILQRYAASNAWVREAYFGGADTPGTLFEMPGPSDFRVRSRDELTKQQIQILTKLVFRMAGARDKRGERPEAMDCGECE